MRRKTRITILLTSIAVVFGGGGVSILLRQRILDQRALDSRARGVEAVKTGDYKDGLHQIGSYLQRFGQDTDAEAMYQYARARVSLPLPKGKHLEQAIAMLRRAVEIDPSLVDAQHELLELYPQIGYLEETQALAKTVLEKNPDDAAALRADAIALARKRKFPEALAQLARATKLAPEKLESHALALQIMKQNGASNDEIIAYPGSQPGLNPDQPEYQFLQATAYEFTGREEEARVWFRRAAENVKPDSEDVLVISNSLDLVNLLDESKNLLARASHVSSNFKVKEKYCRRLFDEGDIPGLMAETDGKPYADLESSIIALRGMALGREGKKDELQKVVAELDGRTDDAVAGAWSSVLRVIWLDNEQSAQKVSEVCKTALDGDPLNPYFQYFLGVAYSQLGDNEHAIDAWKNTIRIAPAWVDPLMRCAGLLASIGRLDDAMGVAQVAKDRAPRNGNVLAAVADILGPNIEKLSEEQRKELLKMCQQVQAAKPREPRTLPLVVDLLARQGATATAAQILQSALDSGDKLPENTLIRLANLSETHGLGLTQACFDRAGSSGSATPALAFAQATSMLKAGDADRGRTYIEKAAGDAGNGLEWQVAVAQYLDLSGSKDALPIWSAIAKKETGNPALLNQVLNSRSAWEDTAMIDEVINQLKVLTGDDASAWRTARARWLLLTEPESVKAAAEAADLLSDTMHSALPDLARYGLLATALEKLNNKDGAIDCLKQAVDLVPEAAATRLELIRLLYVRGKAEDAAPHIDKILSTSNLDPAMLRRTADLLASQGELTRAIEVLLRLHSADDQVAPLDLPLAQLYRRAGQPDKAEVICRRYLQEKPDAGAVEFAADLYASMGKNEEAQAALQKLDGLGLAAGVKEMILAEYNRSHGAAEEAGKWYEEALKASGTDPVIWKRMLAFFVSSGSVDRALQRVPDAVTACPSDEHLKALAGQLELFKRVQNKRMAVPFIMAALQNPGNVADAASALSVVDTVPENDTVQLAAAFKKLSESSPTFLPAKMELVRLYGALNRHDEAAELAAQAMREFPAEVEPAMLAAEAYGATQKWSDAMEAAREMRRRAPQSASAADLIIANAQIRLDAPADALKTIEPYLTTESRDSAEFSPIIVSQARALIHSARVADAADLIRPRLTASSAWRMAWLQLATLDLPAVKDGANWLEEVGSLIPEDAMEERVALASAWYQLYERNKQESGFRDKARTILNSVATRPDATGKSVLALAVFAEQDQDFATAESSYRRALELDPTLTAARNNLAMRFITDKKNLPEALQLAQQAVKEAPQNANVLDTLAQAQAALGDLDGAIASLTAAVGLEPGNRDWAEKLEQYKQKQGGQSGATAAPSQQ